MTNIGLITTIFLFIIIFNILKAFFYIIGAGYVGVLKTFGKVTGKSKYSGLHFKIPLVQQINYFNVRTQVIPEEFESLTRDLQVIKATATIKYAIKPEEAGRIVRTIAGGDGEIYPKIIKPSLLKALKSVFSQYELVYIVSKWNEISSKVADRVKDELDEFDYVNVKSLDLTGLRIAEEYRSAIEQKQIAEQLLLKAQTEVKIAEQEAIRYEKFREELDDKVLYKLFLDKWDGQTQVVPGLPSIPNSTPSVIVNSRKK